MFYVYATLFMRENKHFQYQSRPWIFSFFLNRWKYCIDVDWKRTNKSNVSQEKTREKKKMSRERKRTRERKGKTIRLYI